MVTLLTLVRSYARVLHLDLQLPQSESDSIGDSDEGQSVDATKGCEPGVSASVPPLWAGLEVLWGDLSYDRYQSGHLTVGIGACIITVLQYVYTWLVLLVLQFIGRSGPTGTRVLTT